MDDFNGDKPFIPVNLQVEKLISRGLVVSDLRKAEKQLLRTSYYDLINGYKDMFLMPKEKKTDEDQFIRGTSFEDIRELYEFDRKLRQSILEMTLDIECAFYSSMAYSMALVYGEKQEDYLDIKNYKWGRKQTNGRTERENLFKRINRKVGNPEIQPLLYYKETYNNIPPWILVKDLTFGELVIMYKLSKDSVKTEVIKNIIGKNPTEQDKEFFFKVMELFNKFRNWAAHGGRMYNHYTNIELPYLEELHTIFGLTKLDHNRGNGRNDFAAFLIGIIYFFIDNPRGTFEFFVNIQQAVERHIKTKPPLFEGVLGALGVPIDFYTIALEEMFNFHKEAMMAANNEK
ncbi:Abi family protein [Planococcus halocryophilus]|nr:Abi family protein [Planococcus halocryophilus]